VRVIITGEAGGAWSLVGRGEQWALFEEVEAKPAAVVTLDEDAAWRLYTKGIDRERARQQLSFEGDADLALVMLDAIAIIA
jgi:hypothetical protein